MLYRSRFYGYSIYSYLNRDFVFTSADVYVDFIYLIEELVPPMMVSWAEIDVDVVFNGLEPSKG